MPLTAVKLVAPQQRGRPSSPASVISRHLGSGGAVVLLAEAASQCVTVVGLLGSVMLLISSRRCWSRRLMRSCWCPHDDGTPSGHVLVDKPPA